ncbi:MAG TPA: MFS transporter [Candidatus Dormibacteraeota bacterium]|nr:MFS transporter [Candidatus Dormibacteraeota bacterium]
MQRTAWSHGQRLLTAGLVFMVTAIAFEGLAIPTVLPATLDDLGGLVLYGWAFSAFWLTNLVGITLAGLEADRRGPLLPFVAGTICFALGLAVAGLAPSMAWVVAGRAIQGLGAGAIGSVTYVAIARGYSSEAQPRMIAVISSAWVLPGLLGPALAGYITEATSWRWAILGLAPLLPLAALAVAGPMSRLGVAVPARSPGGAVGKVRDAFQLAVGAAVLLGSLSAPSLLLGAPAAIVGVLLVRGPLQRLLPPGTLSARPGPGAAVVVLALVSASFLGVEAFVPLAVSSIRGAGPIAGGLALTAAAVTWATGSWLQARLAPRRSRRALTAAGLLLVMVGIALETLVPLTAVPAVALAAFAWAVAGLGMGLAYSTATLVIIETAPVGGEGGASAAAQLANTLGIAVGTGLAGGVVSLSASTILGLAPGIAIANLLLIVAAAIGLAIVGRMPDRPPERRTRRMPATDHGPTL